MTNNTLQPDARCIACVHFSTRQTTRFVQVQRDRRGRIVVARGLCDEHGPQAAGEVYSLPVWHRMQAVAS